jgi:hypothetical protein
MKKLLILLFWIPTTFLTLIFSLGLYSYNQNLKVQAANNPNALEKISQMPYQLYASIPSVLGAQTVDEFYIKSQDVTPKLIETYLKKHNSPMTDTYQDLILAARKYEIDPVFMIAIAQCESNLGKKMPHKTEDIYECHNPFGWGIHKGGTLCFDTWEEGYQKVAEGLRRKYYNQGYETTEDIMKKYTPPALENGGSWAICVNKFMKQLQILKEEM